ncbi:hypothetical protein ERX46_16785 [Brumimicrobium glaciale]|uniref:Uncharacterized protein n=1 Tax=Brumimicrobium glaciale TaxID=200475 RepID=A0A4Q4KF52_9FLAO|nr:hypothetical protein [Brumimicrobium glaciale]RYM31338.1 hypothetical protein ERX46_16785 [Brumimicrobium glaciale]
MAKSKEKPSPEVKALSLFLMAFKKKSPAYQEKSKRINNLWNKVVSDDLSKAAYLEEVQNMLASFGGYSVVIEKTVRHFIEKTGEWKLEGNDKFCVDAKKVADKILEQKKKAEKAEKTEDKTEDKKEDNTDDKPVT